MSYLPQDLPQREEQLAPQRKAEERKYREDVAAREKEQKKAEEQYQKDLEAYNKQIAEQNKKTAQQEIEEKYVEKIRTLEEAKKREIQTYEAATPTFDARSRDIKVARMQQIGYDYDRKIADVQREKQSVLLPIILKEEGYPSYVIDKAARGFRKGDIKSVGDAIQYADKYYAGKQAKIQRNVETSLQQVATTPRYTQEQTTQIQAGSAGLLGTSTPEMQARAASIKPTPDVITGKRATETRARLTGVDTGQSIMGGQIATPPITISYTESMRYGTERGQVLPVNLTREIQAKAPSKGVSPKTNPLALVAGMFRQDVDISGKPIEKKAEPSNIDILKSTLSRYQSVYGSEQKAPFASVLEASLTERGRTVGVMERLFIEKSAYKQYKTRAEAFGLIEAKGEKATFINPKTGKKFSAETGMGDVTIGRQLGFVFDYNLQRPTTEYPKTFEGSLSYVVSPKVQGPQKPKEETVIAVPGSLEYALGEQRKETGFNKLIESQYNKLGEMQEVVKKRGNILEQLAYAPSEIVRSGLGTMAMIVNISEQYVDPFVQKSLGLKQTIQPRPIALKSDVSGTVILPYQFEKGRFDYSSKEWASRQAKFIEKKGVPAYALGVGFDYLGLAGTPSLIRGGIKSIPKLSSKLSAPVKKEAVKILEKKISFMLDSGKQKTFSYDIPYSPAKRPNEIDYSDFGERIGPTTPLTKKPVAAKQSDVIIPIPKKEKPVSLDPFYKPRGRHEGGFEDVYSDKGEIIGPHSLLSQKPVAAKQSDIILPKPIKPELRGKQIKPVEEDPFYKPAKRKGEIDLTRDDILATFMTTKVKLGKGIPKPIKPELRGKQIKPVEEDPFYKPAKRKGEIDISDFGEKIKMPKIEPEKSEIQLNLKRELKRLKRKQPEFRSEKIEFRGQGTEIKSGSQMLLTIQKQEKLTKKKLKTQRQTPVSIDWSEKIETSEIPKIGKAPLKTVLIPIKETKKKPYLQEKKSAIESYEIQLSEQRPMIKTVPKTSFRFSQPQRIQEAIRYSQPQRLQTSQPQRERTRLKEVVKLTSIQISTPKQRQSLKTTPKLAAPLSPKQPTRLAQPQKFKTKTPQILRYREPEPKRPPKLLGGFLPVDKKIKKDKVRQDIGEKADFLGNVSETQIEGIFGKRSETVYGQSKINRLLKGDVRVVKGQQRTIRRSKKKFDLMGFKKGKSKDKVSFW